jgi:hypothetical protein
VCHRLTLTHRCSTDLIPVELQEGWQEFMKALLYGCLHEAPEVLAHEAASGKRYLAGHIWQDQL